MRIGGGGDGSAEQKRTVTGVHAGGAKEATPQIALVVVHYADPRFIGTVIPLEEPVTIGRGPTGPHDVTLASDERASRQHAQITKKRGNFVLSDLGSKNATFVDGKKVDSCNLAVGNIIRVGDTMFELSEVAPGNAGASFSRDLLGVSAGFLSVMSGIERVAATDMPVLILGETGTGKELVAKRLHERSKRRGELVAINCAAVPETLFESHIFGHKKGAFTGATQDFEGALGRAAGGTLFLDEIGEMPLSLQPKLLRVLETGEYQNVGSTKTEQATARIVSATNVVLETEVRNGNFRSDLFARLSGWIIEIPPLRSRRSDIMVLAHHFYASAAPDRTLAVDPNRIERMLTYDWPLNVRELRTVMRRLALVEDGAQAALLDRALSAPAPVVVQVSEPKTREALIEVLRSCGGSIARVAETFGKDRKQVYRWLEKFNLTLEEARDGEA